MKVLKMYFLCIEQGQNLFLLQNLLRRKLPKSHPVVKSSFLAQNGMYMVKFALEDFGGIPEEYFIVTGEPDVPFGVDAGLLALRTEKGFATLFEFLQSEFGSNKDLMKDLRKSKKRLNSFFMKIKPIIPVLP